MCISFTLGHNEQDSQTFFQVLYLTIYQHRNKLPASKTPNMEYNYNNFLDIQRL